MIKDLFKTLFRLNDNQRKKDAVNMSNVVNSMFNSQALYDQLKVKCHPDRFPNDEEKRKQAEVLFQEIQKNRYNMEVLKELEKKVDTLMQ